MPGVRVQKMRKMLSKQKSIHIGPGEYHVSNQDVIISTALGSCVAVCLYDPIQKVVGMNHIMLSQYEYDPNGVVCDLRGGRIGLCAMTLVVADMLNMGAEKKNLRAKAFGGASMFKPYDQCVIDYCVGKKNDRFIRHYLKKNSIPLVAEDLGGDHGRKILFYWKDFTVKVKKIGNRGK